MDTLSSNIDQSKPKKKSHANHALDQRPCRNCDKNFKPAHWTDRYCPTCQEAYFESKEHTPGKNTKIKGDIAEQAAILHALKQGYGVLKPVGDRLAYDLVFDVNGKLLKIQVKYAWLNSQTNTYIASCRRIKTNRVTAITAYYSKDDFDFALVYIEDTDIFYVIPVSLFIQSRSNMSFVEGPDRLREPRSKPYRDAWHLLDS